MMGEHKRNPVVIYLDRNPRVKISSQEVKRMRGKGYKDNPWPERKEYFDIFGSVDEIDK